MSNNQKTAYPKPYLEDFVESVRSVFKLVVHTPCNVIQTLDAFLGCSVFYEVNFRANPKYLNMSYRQLLECLSFDDGFNWKETEPTNDDYDPHIMWWAGMILTVFQWKYRVDFRNWLKYYSVEDVYNMYYPLHEASVSVSADKLYEMYQYKKKNKMFRSKNS